MAITVAVSLAMAVAALMYGTLGALSSSSTGPLLLRMSTMLFGIAVPYFPLQPRLNAFVVILFSLLHWSVLAAWVGYRVEGLRKPRAYLWAAGSVLVVGVLVDAILLWFGYQRNYT